MKWVNNHSIKRELDHILHLPLIERIMHYKSQKVLKWVFLSFLVMIAASSISVHKEELSNFCMVSHIIIDALAYLLHGIGAVPFVKYAEPLWMIVVGEEW